MERRSRGAGRQESALTDSRTTPVTGIKDLGEAKHGHDNLLVLLVEADAKHNSRDESATLAGFDG